MCLCLFFKILTGHIVVNIRLSIHQRSALWSLKCMKFVFRPGLRPGARWGSSRCSPTPLIGWGGGNPLHIFHPPRRLRRLGLVVPANWGDVSILQGGWKALALNVRLRARMRQSMTSRFALLGHWSVRQKVNRASIHLYPFFYLAKMWLIIVRRNICLCRPIHTWRRRVGWPQTLRRRLTAKLADSCYYCVNITHDQMSGNCNSAILSPTSEYTGTTQYKLTNMHLSALSV